VYVIVTADGVWDWTTTIRSVVHLTASCLLWALGQIVRTHNIITRYSQFRLDFCIEWQWYVAFITPAVFGVADIAIRTVIKTKTHVKIWLFHWIYVRTRWYRLMIFIVSTEIPPVCFHWPAVYVVVTADGVWDWTATIRSVVHLTASCLLWALCIWVWTNNIRRRLEKALSL